MGYDFVGLGQVLLAVVFMWPFGLVKLGASRAEIPGLPGLHAPVHSQGIERRVEMHRILKEVYLQAWAAHYRDPQKGSTNHPACWALF